MHIDNCILLGVCKTNVVYIKGKKKFCKLQNNFCVRIGQKDGQHTGKEEDEKNDKGGYFN